MTKYEWEKELKNNLKRIPEAEVARILDYYNELFADKEDEGMSEKEIVRKFGNPFDVAYKILYDYQAGSTMAEVLENEDSAVHTDPKSKTAPQESRTLYTKSKRQETIPYTSYASHAEQGLSETPDLSQKPQETERRGGTFGFIARLVFFLPYMIAMIVLWSLVIGFAAGGFGAAVGGVAMVFAGFWYQLGIGVTLAYAGGGIAATGVGLLMLVGTGYFVKFAVKLTQKYFYMGKHKTERRYR